MNLCLDNPVSVLLSLKVFGSDQQEVSFIFVLDDIIVCYDNVVFNKAQILSSIISKSLYYV